MIPGTDWYFRVSRGVCFTGYQLSFRVSRGVDTPLYMIPGTDWYFRVFVASALPGISCPSGFLVASSFTGYQLSFRVSRGVDTPLCMIPGTDWYFRVSRGVCFTGYQLSFRVSRGVDTRLSTVEIIVAAVTNVVRSPYRRSTIIHRRKNNCVSILINFIQYQPI